MTNVENSHTKVIPWYDGSKEIETVVKMKGKHVKVAISIPAETFQRLENLRKQMKLSRSEWFALAARKWTDAIDGEVLVRQYLAGYRDQPESLAEAKALESAQVQVLSKEKW